MLPRDLHLANAWFMIGANAVAGTWALLAHRVAPARGRPLWIWIIVAQVAVCVQAVLGVLVMTGEDLPRPDFHLLYGFTAVMTVGILYSYREQVAWRYLLYAAGSYFLMGLGIRNLFIDG